jgi:hypothetical protein
VALVVLADPVAVAAVDQRRSIDRSGPARTLDPSLFSRSES